MRKCSHTSEDGFVLSEILVAMVVLAIAVISFLHLVQSSAGSMSKARGLDAQTTIAHATLQSALNSTQYEAEPYDQIDEVSGLRIIVSITPDPARQSKSPEQPSIGIVTVEVLKPGRKSVTLKSAKWMKRGAAQ